MADPKDNKGSGDNRREIMEMLAKLDEQIQTLRIEFEQYFAGVVAFQPEKLKAEVERSFRNLLKAPLKNSELNFRARSLKYRFNTLDTYWRRVLKEKEDGRYHKDIFKAEHRKKRRSQLEKSKSKEGVLEQQMKQIYSIYTRCLNESGFSSGEVSFDAFQVTLSQRASSLRKANPGKKIQFSVVLKDGKPSVEASVKE